MVFVITKVKRFFVIVCVFLFDFYSCSAEIFSKRYNNGYNKYSVTVEESNHIIFASKILRPNIPFGIMIHTFDNVFNRCSNRSLDFYASILSSSNESISSSIVQNLFCNTNQVINLPVPISLSIDDYVLHVYGIDHIDKGKLFDYSLRLRYESDFVSVVFQTTRPIYSSDQTVRFRILVLQTSLIPYNDVMDVFILDPDGIIMKRWLSVYTNTGVATLSFKLPKLAKNGAWKIKTQIHNQINEKSIIVETYFKPFFEVIVSSLPYVEESDDTLNATICGMYSTKKLVRGNATIIWSARKFRENDKFFDIQTDYVFLKEVHQQIFLPLEALRKIFKKIDAVEVKILVHMTEFMSGETMSGFSHSRIISDDVKIEFLSKSPIIFTPGMPLFGYVSVSYEDNEKIPLKMLENSILKIEIECDSPFNDGKYVSEIVVKGCCNEKISDGEFYDVLLENRIREKYLENGILSFRFDIPKSAEFVNLKAIFRFDEKIKEKTLPAVKRDSPSSKYINIWTSSSDLKVDDYAMFHVKTNFVVNTFYILVLSKGILLRVYEHETSSSSLITFSIPISSDMAPLFHLIIYSICNNSTIHSDSVTVPVDGFSRYETTFEVNTGKDFRNERIEALASGGEGAFIGIQATRSIVYHMQGGNEITRSRMANNFLMFEKNFKSVSKVDRISRDGSSADESVFFPTHNFVLDIWHGFERNYLFFRSNLMELNFEDDCNNNSGNISCSSQKCTRMIEMCNWDLDCDANPFDKNCVNSENERKDYLLNRISRNYFIYDADDGDWAFREIKKNDHVGVEFEFMNAPATGDDWYFTVFNMHMIYGFSMIEMPSIFSSVRPLMAHVIGPHKCHRGEQLGLKLHLHNHDQNQMFVIVTLVESNEYKFVNVEDDGIVSSYNAVLTFGEHQLLIYMPAESETELRFPVAPFVERGYVEIKFLISSQAGRAHLSHLVNVMSEGALINRHTSITLDLKNRGFSLDYLDIVVEENPYVPYNDWRRYVYGSPSANLTISNDVIAPVDFESSFTMNKLLKRESKGAIDFAFELNSNIWILHYLRLTNQLNSQILKQVLSECGALYSTIIRYFDNEGFFSNWEPTLSYPSVWLSAWIIRVLKHTNFPEWQFIIWIDPYVIKKTLQWLLTYQAVEGYFTETSDYIRNPFDARFVNENLTEYRIALTVHVLITLKTVEEFADGELNSHVMISVLNARKYLEKKLPSIKDPYLLAMISYAFVITDSPENYYAFNLLHKNLRVDEDGNIYWSRLHIPSNPVKLENQKPYRMPRLYLEANSYAVEATSWALLVYLAKEGVTPLVENIVKWLISMRMLNYGFVSLVDTAVAYQALTEYAFRSRFVDLTNIYVTVEMMALNVTTCHLRIANKSATISHLEVPFVWGHINIAGKGAGIAYVQMDVNYGVDHTHLVDKPQLPSFELNVTEYYSRYRNKSMITIESCLRYVRESPAKSGAAILEIQIPTGYFLLETQANEIIRHKSHPTLRDVRSTEEKTIWFFDFLDHDMHCFNHTIKRWYPVGNMTRCRQALLYELTAREHFTQVLIDSTALYTLSICEVCGSYQCPYCPYYNGAIESARFFKVLLLITTLFIMMFNRNK